MAKNRKRNGKQNCGRRWLPKNWREQLTIAGMAAIMAAVATWFVAGVPSPTPAAYRWIEGSYRAAIDRRTDLAQPAAQMAAVSDPEPPTVEIISPKDGEIVSGTVQVVAKVTDDVGVANVQFRIDGMNLAADATDAFDTWLQSLRGLDPVPSALELHSDALWAMADSEQPLTAFELFQIVAKEPDTTSDTSYLLTPEILHWLRSLQVVKDPIEPSAIFGPCGLPEIRSVSG